MFIVFCHDSPVLKFTNLSYTLADFAEQIDLAQYDEHKSLNLLRGFFYWLEVSFPFLVLCWLGK